MRGLCYLYARDCIIASVMWYRGPYFILSCVLLLTTLTYALAAGVLGAAVLQIVTTLMLLSALYAAIGSRPLFRGMVVLLVPTLAVNWIAYSKPDSVLEGIALLAAILFFSITLVAVFRHIVTSRRVTADVIFGSIAVYLLFGIVLALAYAVVNTLDPGNAISSVTPTTPRRGEFSDFLYFSFITLTSVGYGDVTPVGSAARSLAMFEGIFGQLYVAILIARLVSIHISQG